MYECPITLITSCFMDEFQAKYEDAILKTVQRIGVDVDKEELLKALNYDRNQYAKGFAEAKAIYKSKWIPCSERLPDEEGQYFVTRYDYVTKISFRDILWYECQIWWNREFVGDVGKFAVVAWMPLPEPWKGADDE